VTAAARLLRPGGLLVMHAVLASRGAPGTLRDVTLDVRDSEEWLPALLPVGEGLLAAVRV
jgi:predicted O-methyltransferase YrrM